jgi:hypothetical protein
MKAPIPAGVSQKTRYDSPMKNSPNPGPIISFDFKELVLDSSVIETPTKHNLTYYVPKYIIYYLPWFLKLSRITRLHITL